ncbi:hypothetical protein GCK72_017011 [Caenorhabditis remanei]|uniref:RING-type domain-containing protein n=1 Tax=Caenorhabditis remanei TaxID=31234 RepID=A0A6A5G6W6_CAERE|nr:hypothetical protein GCK72_017011 [Caenorhabditis remanei]KAF1750461.1 hypothetical protein GCK72_017011 [Caenorhabditis remanei]
MSQEGYLKDGGKCYKIGYLGVLLCAIAPYLVFAKYGIASENAVYGFYIFHFKSLFLYLSFMLPNTERLVLGVEREHEDISEYFRSNLQWILIIFLSSVWYFKVWFSPYPVVYLQIMHTAVQIIVLSDFWIVWFVERNKRKVELETKKEEENFCFEQEKSILRYNKLKCSVCKSFYHESIERRTPQMLECRHTFCQGCTKKLSKNLYIICPICWEDTNIDELKKNYALLGIIQEMKTVQRRRSFS